MFTASELKFISDNNKLTTDQVILQAYNASIDGDNSIEIKSCRIKDLAKTVKELKEAKFEVADMPYYLRIVFNK